MTTRNGTLANILKKLVDDDCIVYNPGGYLVVGSGVYTDSRVVDLTPDEIEVLRVIVGSGIVSHPPTGQSDA